MTVLNNTHRNFLSQSLHIQVVPDTAPSRRHGGAALCGGSREARGAVVVSECWRAVPSFDGRYLISKYARARRSLPRRAPAPTRETPARGPARASAPRAPPRVRAPSAMRARETLSAAPRPGPPAPPPHARRPRPRRAPPRPRAVSASAWSARRPRLAASRRRGRRRHHPGDAAAVAHTHLRGAQHYRARRHRRCQPPRHLRPLRRQR